MFIAQTLLCCNKAKLVSCENPWVDHYWTCIKIGQKCYKGWMLFGERFNCIWVLLDSVCIVSTGKRSWQNCYFRQFSRQCPLWRNYRHSNTNTNSITTVLVSLVAWSNIVCHSCLCLCVECHCVWVCSVYVTNHVLKVKDSSAGCPGIWKMSAYNVLALITHSSHNKKCTLRTC